MKERAHMREIIENFRQREENMLTDTILEERGRAKSREVTVKKKKKSRDTSLVEKSGDLSELSSSFLTKSKVEKQIQKIGGKNKQKIAHLEEELKLKCIEIYKLNSEIEDTKSILRLEERKVDDEKRENFNLKIKYEEMEAALGELKNQKRKLVEGTKEEIAIEMERLRTAFEVLKGEKERMVKDLIIKDRGDEVLREEIIKSKEIIKEQERELNIKESTFTQRTGEIQGELTKHNIERLAHSQEIQEFKTKLEKAGAEINILSTKIKELQGKISLESEDKGKVDVENKDLEQVVLQQEHLIGVCKTQYERVQNNHLTQIQNLKDELTNIMTSNEKLVQLYESQLKILKERFTYELGEIVMSKSISTPNAHRKKKPQQQSPKKDQESTNPVLTVELMFQLSQREAALNASKTEKKLMGNKLAQQKGKNKKLKEGMSKLQGEIDIMNKQKKTKGTVTPLSKSRIKYNIKDESNIMRYSDISDGKQSKMQENNNLLSYFDNIEAYNILLQQKTEMEIKFSQLKNTLKMSLIEKETYEDKIYSLESQLQNILGEGDQVKELQKQNKKEHNELTKKHKLELEHANEQILVMQETWISPETIDKIRKHERDLESQIRGMKEELNRKRELLATIKSKDEIRQNEQVGLINEIEIIKDDREKLKREHRENIRKDQTICSQKQNLEASKQNEIKLTEEISTLQERVKSLKSESARKESLHKGFKEKMDILNKEIEKLKSEKKEIEKLKEKLRA